jgi:hypothetical protein
MPEYYREIELFKHSFGFYYDSKRHRYKISIDYGEKYIDVTRKEGETIFRFLKQLKEFLSRRNIRDGSIVEEDFDILEVDDSFDKTDFEDEWDSWEKDELAEEIAMGDA